MTEKALTKAKGVLEDISEEKWSRENLEKILMDTAEKKLVRAESSRGDFLWPLRVALTGAERSPSPFEIAWVLGKNESLKRIKNAIELLK